MSEAMRESKAGEWESVDELSVELDNMVPIAIDALENDVDTPVLDELSFEGIARYIKSGKCKNILVLTGAGTSASAGVADFYNPSAKIIESYKKTFKLPSKDALLDFNFFIENPEPFFALMKEIFPDLAVKPTVCHYFIRLLSDKGLLLRNYTQNVDSLEYRAKIPDAKIIEARGTFKVAHCTDSRCRKDYPLDWILEKISCDDVPSCTQCDSLIRPDIIFTEESIPDNVFKFLSQDFSKCHLLIVIGTILNVQPLASMYQRVSKKTPRLIINKEKGNQSTHHIIDSIQTSEDDGDGIRDVIWLGGCDDGCIELAIHLGWWEELQDLIKQEYEQLDAEVAAREELKKAKVKGCCSLV